MTKNSSKQEFESCLDLWLPTDLDAAKELLPSLLRTQRGLDKLLNLEISFNDYLAILESEGIDMDSYLDTSLFNCYSNGF